MSFLQRLNRNKNKNLAEGLKNASFLAGANITSELVTFITFLFVARHFLPDEYGIYTTVLTYVAMFEVLTLRGVNKTIIRSAAEIVEDLQVTLEKGASLRFLFIIGATLLCNILLLFIDYSIKTKALIIVFSLSLFFHEMTRFYYSAFYVLNKINIVAGQTITSRLFFALLTFLIILLKGDIGYLVIASLTVNIVFLGVTRITLKKNKVKVGLLIFPKFEKGYFRSGLTFSLFEAVTMLATRFDLFLISLLGSPRDVGIYGVAFKVAQQVLMLRNVNQDSFFPLVVKRLKSGIIRKETIFSFSLIMFLIVFIPTIIFSFFSKEIVSFLFGQHYAEAGPILTYLLIFVSFAWGTLPFTVLAQSAYKEELLLKVRIGMAISNVIMDIVFYKFFGLIGIAYVSALVWSIGSIIMCYAIYRSIYFIKK